VFFEEQSTKSLNKAIEKFEKIEFNYKYIHEHSKQFSIENFKFQISKIIDEATLVNKKKENTK